MVMGLRVPYKVETFLTTWATVNTSIRNLWVWVLVYITTDGQSASLSWNKVSIWGLRPDFYYCQTVEGLLMWRSLSDERMGLSFTIAAGHHQRTHFRVRVPWDSWSYFTVPDSRLLFSSPHTIHRATVEVFDSAPTPDNPLRNVLHGFVYTSVRFNWKRGEVSAV
jgi:hypothetical protein